MIRLNGVVFVEGKEIYLEDFEIEIDENLKIPFDDFDEGCDYDCEDCYFDELEEDFEQDEFNESLDELLDVYSEALSESCICPECIREALVDFLNSFVEL